MSVQSVQNGTTSHSSTNTSAKARDKKGLPFATLQEMGEAFRMERKSFKNLRPHLHYYDKVVTEKMYRAVMGFSQDAYEAPSQEFAKVAVNLVKAIAGWQQKFEESLGPLFSNPENEIMVKANRAMEVDRQLLKKGIEAILNACHKEFNGSALAKEVKSVQELLADPILPFEKLEELFLKLKESGRSPQSPRRKKTGTYRDPSPRSISIRSKSVSKSTQKNLPNNLLVDGLACLIKEWQEIETHGKQDVLAQDILRHLMAGKVQIKPEKEVPYTLKVTLGQEPQQIKCFCDRFRELIVFFAERLGIQHEVNTYLNVALAVNTSLDTLDVDIIKPVVAYLMNEYPILGKLLFLLRQEDYMVLYQCHIGALKVKLNKVLPEEDLSFNPVNVDKSYSLEFDSSKKNFIAYVRLSQFSQGKYEGITIYQEIKITVPSHGLPTQIQAHYEVLGSEYSSFKIIALVQKTLEATGALIKNAPLGEGVPSRATSFDLIALPPFDDSDEPTSPRKRASSYSPRKLIEKLHMPFLHSPHKEREKEPPPLINDPLLVLNEIVRQDVCNYDDIVSVLSKIKQFAKEPLKEQQVDHIKILLMKLYLSGKEILKHDPDLYSELLQAYFGVQLGPWGLDVRAYLTSVNDLKSWLNLVSIPMQCVVNERESLTLNDLFRGKPYEGFCKYLNCLNDPVSGYQLLFKRYQSEYQNLLPKAKSSSSPRSPRELQDKLETMSAKVDFPDPVLLNQTFEPMLDYFRTFFNNMELALHAIIRYLFKHGKKEWLAVPIGSTTREEKLKEMNHSFMTPAALLKVVSVEVDDKE